MSDSLDFLLSPSQATRPAPAVSLPSPPSIAPPSTVAGNRAATPPLAERDLLVFKALGKSVGFDHGAPGAPYRRVSFAQATCGLAAFGATGCGKTAGFMRPALRALALNGCPGLVLDVKGDYLAHLLALCPERTLVVGPGRSARPVNLIAGISLEVFSTLLENLRLRGNGKDGYWGSSAIEDAKLVFLAIRHYTARAPTLHDIAQVLSQPIEFGPQLRQWLETGLETDAVVPDELRRMHQRRLTDRFSLLNYTDAAGRSNDTAREQYTWHTNHLLPALLPFSEDEALRTTLCATDALNWADLLYEDNKIIVFDMPSTIFGATAFVASRIMRLLVMQAILSDTRKFAVGSPFGTDRFSFILADEYQEYVNTANTRGLVNDNTFFDRSRSCHHINVVATQGVSSLIAQVGVEGVNAVLQNLRTKLFLATDDRQTLDRAATVACRSDVAMPDFLSNPTRPWSGFLYAPLVDGTSSPGSGPVLTGAAADECPHMRIDHALEGRVRAWELFDVAAWRATQATTGGDAAHQRSTDSTDSTDRAARVETSSPPPPIALALPGRAPIVQADQADQIDQSLDELINELVEARLAKARSMQPDPQVDPQAVAESKDAPDTPDTFLDQPFAFNETFAQHDRIGSLPEPEPEPLPQYWSASEQALAPCHHATRTLQTLDDAIDRLRVVRDMMSSFGGSLSHHERQQVLDATLALLAHLNPMAVATGAMEAPLSVLLAAPARAAAPASSPVAAPSSAPALAIARLEVEALKADVRNERALARRASAFAERMSEDGVLAPVAGRLATTCADWLYQQQSGVIGGDPRYQAPADWSFLRKDQARTMACQHRITFPQFRRSKFPHPVAAPVLSQRGMRQPPFLGDPGRV